MFSLNEALALIALVCFRTALLNMSDPSINFKYLFTELTRSWLHVTFFFMVTELYSRCCEWTILAFDGFVGSFFVFFTLRFWNNFTTFSALVVISCTSNFMHAELRRWNWLFTSGANFRLFYLLYHFKFKSFYCCEIKFPKLKIIKSVNLKLILVFWRRELAAKLGSSLLMNQTIIKNLTIYDHLTN